MPSLIFLYITIYFFSGVIIVTCNNNSKNLFSIERITKEGLNFLDIAKTVVKNRTLFSPQCGEQLFVLLQQPEVLLRMADAWSKFPYSGAFFVATRSDWANYDECIKVDVHSTSSGVRVLGKFCAWGFILPDLSSSDLAENAWKLSSCIPDKCTAKDLITATGLPIFNEWSCSTKQTDTELDTGAIITILIIALVIAAMIVSTSYDMYLHYAKKKTAHAILTAFSVNSNGKKLLAVSKQSKEQILCFNGMKFVTMWWLISGHGALAWSIIPVEVDETFSKWNQRRVSQYMTTAFISLDTFFYISGFLMSYLYLRRNVTNRTIIYQFKSTFFSIVHRYLRLTPACGMLFLTTVYLFKYLNNGPFYSFAIHTIMEPCQKYWWTYFLYIQNYYNFNFDEMLCIPTTWYLSADIQLYIIALLALIPISFLYWRSLKTAMAVLFLLNIFFFVLPIFTKLTWQDYDPLLREYDTHGKLISYFIGIMMGMYMRNEKGKKVIISRKLNILLWFLALCMMNSVMWYRGEVELHYGYVARSICYSISRPLWCISLCWITYACVNGYGGVINWFLSCAFMQFYTNCGHFIVSILLATFWTLAFELPIVTLEKEIFRPGRPKASKSNVNNSHDSPQKVV